MSTATARANIALVKYWGKRDTTLNLPAVGSLSLTLSSFRTRTEVTFVPGLGADALELDGRPAGEDELARTSRHLDRIRARAGILLRARVVSANEFPTASGLASSASGFAALTAAAAAAAGLAVGPAEMSALARMGSGSAARSIFGGFVEWKRGERADGADSVAEPIDTDDFDVQMVVAVGGRGPKKVGSTDGMELSRRTSPFYDAWVAHQPAELAAARAAIAHRDFSALGEITERSALRMHACAMASDPGLLYWRPSTIEGIERVRELRARGVEGWVTIDAGPHVKVLTRPPFGPLIAEALRSVPGITEVRVETPGPGVEVVP